MNETQTLVRFLVDMDYDALPSEVQATAKLCLLDTLGVGIFGAQTQWSGVVMSMAKAAAGTGESTVWGHDLKVCAQHAALVNGTSAHGLEMDDRKPAFRAHVGSIAVPAAIAAAERAGCDGKTLLSAIVAGYEAGFRVGRSVPGQYERGMFTPAHAGTWGATAAACKAQGLTYEQTLDAFGIAGSMASGIREYMIGTGRDMVKRMHSGWSAHNGVMAAILAQYGMTAPQTVLEGKFGYCNVYGGAEGADLEQLSKDYGLPYQILLREVKPYAAQGGSHVCIEAVQQFKAQYPVQADEIEKIIIGTCTFLIGHHEHREPTSITAAQHSLPFITALSFFKDLADPTVWKSELLSDAAVLGLAQRVEWHVDAEMEGRHQATRGYGGARITIRLRDHREFHTVVYNAKGTEANPMTSQEIHHKFNLLAGHVLPKEHVGRIAEAVDALDKSLNVRELCRLLTSSVR